MAAIHFEGLRFHLFNQFLAKVSKSTGRIGPSANVGFCKGTAFEGDVLVDEAEIMGYCFLRRVSGEQVLVEDSQVEMEPGNSESD